MAAQGQEIMDLADLSTPLPSWFTEEDLNAYAALYEKSRLQFPLTLPYRSVPEQAHALLLQDVLAELLPSL